jgi:hypothetical protein
MNDQSKLFTLNTRDAIRAFIMAVATPAVVIIENSVEKGELVFNWHSIYVAAIGGGLAYLVKNFLTPADPIKEVTKTDDGTVIKTVVKTDSVDVKVK